MAFFFFLLPFATSSIFCFSALIFEFGQGLWSQPSIRAQLSARVRNVHFYLECVTQEKQDPKIQQ